VSKPSASAASLPWSLRRGGRVATGPQRRSSGGLGAAPDSSERRLDYD